MSFFEELKRRNVFRVGLAYLLLGWVVLQAADFALDLIDAPNWIIQALFIVGLVGLPFALSQLPELLVTAREKVDHPWLDFAHVTGLIAAGRSRGGGAAARVDGRIDHAIQQCLLAVSLEVPGIKLQTLDLVLPGAGLLARYPSSPAEAARAVRDGHHRSLPDCARCHSLP